MKRYREDEQLLIHSIVLQASTDPGLKWKLKKLKQVPAHRDYHDGVWFLCSDANCWDYADSDGRSWRTSYCVPCSAKYPAESRIDISDWLVSWLVGWLVG